MCVSRSQENVVSKYKSLVEQIRDKCAENERLIMERKGGEINDVVDEMSGDTSTEEEDSVRELDAKTRNLKLSVVDSRKISLTCESLQFQPLSVLEPTVAPSNNNNNFLGEPRKNGRLRSPAPSPIPSPVSSPSPVRSRFHVSKVAENQNSSSCSFNVPSVNKQSSSSSRFKVTVVEPDDRSLLPPSTTSPPLSCARLDRDNTETDSSTAASSRARFEKEDSPTTAPMPSITVSESEQVTTSTKNEWKDTTSSSNPITERIRKLSWVTPILQAPSMAMESAKIPTNFEKLFGFLHNPFVRNASSRSNAEDERPTNDENVASGAGDKASESCEQTLQQQVII